MDDGNKFIHKADGIEWRDGLTGHEAEIAAADKVFPRRFAAARRNLERVTGVEPTASNLASLRSIAGGQRSGPERS
jgi:hypothetical protein